MKNLIKFLAVGAVALSCTGCAQTAEGFIKDELNESIAVMNYGLKADVDAVKLVEKVDNYCKAYYLEADHDTCVTGVTLGVAMMKLIFTDTLTEVELYVTDLTITKGETEVEEEELWLASYTMMMKANEIEEDEEFVVAEETEINLVKENGKYKNKSFAD